MGSKSQESTQSQTQNSMSKLNLDPRSGSEQQILNQFQDLGNNQLSFLTQLLNGGTSPFALNAKDQAQLDTAYKSAFDRFNTQGKDYADYLATTRGLNKSDTPVSQQAMERYGLGMSDLLSQRANAGLNLGLQGTQLRMNGLGITPSGLVNAFNPQMQERFATGTQIGSGSGTMSSRTQYNPSLMDNIGQGMGLGSQMIGLGAQIGGLAMGMPMPSLGGGMGSGAAANSWMGPTKGGQIGGMGSFFQS